MCPTLGIIQSLTMEISRHGEARVRHATKVFEIKDLTAATIDALLEVFVQTELAGALD